MHHPEQFRMTANIIQKERIQQANAERLAAKENGARTGVGRGWPVSSFLELTGKAYLVGRWVTRLRRNLVAKARA